MKGPWRFTVKNGDSKICGDCTACCRWEGDVLFSPMEMEELADYLGMDVMDCAEKYFELSDDRRNLRLAIQKNEKCPFLKADGCSIYEVRPLQCRTFPYGWTREEQELMEGCKLFQEILKRNNLTMKDLQNEKD